MSVPALQKHQLALIKRTIANDCNDAEFDLFIEAARSYGLDPFRKQIIPLVFSKKDPEKRRMSIVVARDGLRIIAQRCKNYRPASEPAQYVYDKALVGPLNPKGIVSVSVKLWQQDNRGEWFPVIGEVDWDEFAPLTNEWAEDDRGKRRPTGNKILDQTGNWARMPKLMIAKCFDEQTEVLTARGFQKFGEVSAPIMQVTDCGLEPVDAAPFAQDYDGLMVTLDSDDLNFCVTPNHDMMTTEGKIEAGDLYEQARSRAKHFIPRIVPAAPLDADFSDHAIMLAAAYLADGESPSGSSFRISVSRPAKIALLEQIGGYYDHTVLACAGNIAHTATRVIETKSDQISFKYGFDVVEDIVSAGKVIDLSVIASFSRRQARLFADHLLTFDGHTQRKSGVQRFYSSNLAIMEAFELAAVIGGYAVSNRKSRTSDIGTKPNFIVTVSDRDAIGVRRWGRAYHGLEGRRDGQRDYNGMTLQPNATGRVWCVTVPSGKIVVRRNGFSMICGNCAEAQALRAGWPDQFGGLYVEEEMDRARVEDMSASEILAHEEQERRVALTSGRDAILVQWLPGMPLEGVSLGTMHDRIEEWVMDPSRTTEQLEAFNIVNRQSLRDFWARSPNDALAVKKTIEQRMAGLSRVETAA